MGPAAVACAWERVRVCVHVCVQTEIPVHGKAIPGGTEHPRVEQEISGPLCRVRGCSRVSPSVRGCETGAKASRCAPVFWFLCLFLELACKSGACGHVPLGAARRRGGGLGVPVPEMGQLGHAIGTDMGSSPAAPHRPGAGQPAPKRAPARVGV